MASVVDDAAEPGCNERGDAGTGTRTGVGTSARMKGDTDGPEVVEGKIVDITTPDKTNKIPILVSY